MRPYPRWATSRTPDFILSITHILVILLCRFDDLNRRKHIRCQWLWHKASREPSIAATIDNKRTCGESRRLSGTVEVGTAHGMRPQRRGLAEAELEDVRRTGLSCKKETARPCVWPGRSSRPIRPVCSPAKVAPARRTMMKDTEKVRPKEPVLQPKGKRNGVDGT